MNRTRLLLERIAALQALALACQVDRDAEAGSALHYGCLLATAFVVGGMRAREWCAATWLRAQVRRELRR